MNGSAEAVARTNIALVKYWGKADAARNLPATGSLSLTLDGLWTRTRVVVEPGLHGDAISLDGRPAPAAVRQRTSRFVDLLRRAAGRREHLRIESRNNFPTAAGLASSASGFAALTLAAARALGLQADAAGLADWARRGSGSAPRSLLGGFVELALDGRGGCRLEQLAEAADWDLRLVVALCASGPKAVGSTAGMERSRRTSPYYAGWLDSHAADLERARSAVAERDLDALGRVAEASCFKMHALAMSAEPPLIYFQPATLAAVRRVWRLRDEGLAGYVTIDAGPHVKVLCAPAAAGPLAAALGQVEGVERVFVERPGAAAEVRP
jgi:diphosphomevalonate decarboxylase